jgi:cysteinyl-tRNA synthetase
MDEDIAVPSALGVIHDTVRRGNSALADGDEEVARSAYAEVLAMTHVLGLSPADFAGGGESSLRKIVEALMPALLASRQAARERKDYQESDRIRDALTQAGIVVEDTADGPRWRVG